MSGDILSDLLRTVRLRGAIFFHIQGAEPWVAEAPASCEILPAVMPGADHLIEFHGVAKGSCWAAIVGEPPLRLDEGDVVLFPQGDSHVMSSAPGMRGRAIDFSLLRTAQPRQLPYAFGVDERGLPIAPLTGSGRDGATIVCGFLGCDAMPYNPLLASLPRMMRMPGVSAGHATLVSQLLRSVVDESNRRRPGGEAVLERMSEMLFVEVVRRYVDELPPGQTGWLAGMRDPGVGRALALLHEKPSEPWTLEQLGKAAGLSRSVLHERFVHFIGQAPMQYLAQWRMQLAAERLRDTDAKLIEIALDVGYESEAAFSRAFRRVVGVAPGAWRRARRKPSLESAAAGS